MPEEEARALVRYALDRGVNLIDTAANYGESEAILGAALVGIPRDRYVLCTKFGPVDGGQLRPAAELAASLGRSLQRLRVEQVDVLQLHGVAPEWYQPARDRFLPELQRLQAAGQCRFLGITETFASDHGKEALLLALGDDAWDTIMVGYNLLTLRPEERVLPLAAERRVGVLVMCAVRRALGRPERLAALVHDLKARGKLAADALPDERPLDWLLGDGIDSVPAAAYRYVAEHPAVSSVLTGTASREHFDANLRSITAPPLSSAKRARLAELFGGVGENLGN